jgi:lipid A 3-O-deacylase
LWFVIHLFLPSRARLPHTFTMLSKFMRITAVFCLFAACAITAMAQEPVGSALADSREIEIWAQGGKGVNGRTSFIGVFDAGARFGWVLTDPHGPGFLRGNFEYAVDVIPVYAIFQENTVYGGGFNPVVLKWNFAGGRRLSPYAEIHGGTLFTTSEVPLGTSNVNFTSGVGGGFQVPLHGDKRLDLSVHYYHISNAGLATPNPGINTIQFRVGLQFMKLKFGTL